MLMTNYLHGKAGVFHLQICRYCRVLITVKLWGVEVVHFAYRISLIAYRSCVCASRSIAFSDLEVASHLNMDTAGESEAELRDVESRLEVEPSEVTLEADAPAAEKQSEAKVRQTAIRGRIVKRPAAVELQGGGDEKRKGTSATLTAFTVQCGRCLKWRKVLEQEEYERIRAHLTAEPFYCEHAQKWHEGDGKITCETPADLLQDGSLIWAMDKQDIPQPPPMWSRRIVVRGSGTSSKFSDVSVHISCQ